MIPMNYDYQEIEMPTKGVSINKTVQGFLMFTTLAKDIAMNTVNQPAKKY